MYTPTNVDALFCCQDKVCYVRSNVLGAQLVEKPHNIIYAKYTFFNSFRTKHAYRTTGNTEGNPAKSSLMP